MLLDNIIVTNWMSLSVSADIYEYGADRSN